MSEQLSCRFCGGRYKANSRNFPLALYGDRDIIDKETKRIVGRKRVIIGYACTKCVRKGSKQVAKEKEKEKERQDASIAEQRERALEVQPKKKKEEKRGRIKQWLRKTFFQRNKD